MIVDNNRENEPDALIYNDCCAYFAPSVYAADVPCSIHDNTLSSFFFGHSS